MYIHLRQDLDLGSIDWKDCNDPKKDLEANEKPSKDTSFGVGKDIQELISNIRTDLDSFNDKESYALMADGYLMTKKFANNITVLKANSTESKWCFDIISPLMSAESTNPKRNELVDILRVASMAAFKVWSLDPVLKAVKFPLILVGGLSFFSLLLYTSGWLTNILGWGYADLNYPLVTISGISKTLIIILATTLIYITISIAMGKSYVAKIITLEKLIKYKDTLTDFLMYLVLSFGGFILAWLHLKIFDSEYLKIGQVEKSEQKH